MRICCLLPRSAVAASKAALSTALQQRVVQSTALSRYNTVRYPLPFPIHRIVPCARRGADVALYYTCTCGSCRSFIIISSKSISYPRAVPQVSA